MRRPAALSAPAVLLWVCALYLWMLIIAAIIRDWSANVGDEWSLEDGYWFA